ncbi:uncharacterized protein LOC134215279 isoform X2 [Armigeres subalbatus]|uniref:uncharacterized protein LOC134215279 isoform X2 n=1 Tax=Armigeres subalbatus TaxID=124917 RepID=UPI002ED11D12
MLKLVSIFTVLFGISVAYTIPAQNAFAHYQRPMAYRTAQRTMYGVHFQNQQFRNQRVAAFPGEAHLDDVVAAEEPVYDPNVEILPEAFPSEQFPVEDEPQADVPAFHELDAEESVADEPLALPAAPAVESVLIPEKKVKKVPVLVDSVEEEVQSTQVARRRGASSSPVPNAYFPINFGGVKGGAVAIANSYSTGKKGTATSTATAYGTPVTAELRRGSSVQLRKKPAKLRVR